MERSCMTEVTPLQSGSKHCTAAMKENARKRQTLPSDCVSFDLMFSFIFSSSFFILHCLSVFLLLLFSPQFLLLHHLIICQCLCYCLSMFWHSISPTLPASLYFALSFSSSLYIFPHCSSLCQSLIHLHCFKGYRVHSSGTLMPVPLS